ncbi:hypothetical protein [Duganella radicis]|uniref:Lipocalin-like domain-containing protein n=1 Tax=Duganella radicis TaxID=551988 RepID=A0A6L6PMR6_9BURK|nr:hypothetical protein [Duganella radicis]MTV39415.1 hypothetical protein [Duganella radicis]
MKHLDLLRQLCRIALIAWVFLIGTNAASAADNSDIYGRWRITKVLGAADVTAMSDKQARALIGKAVVIEPNVFVFNGEKCDAPGYKRTSQDLILSFREEGHASSAKMGLPDPVTSIDAGCTHIFLKKPQVLVIHWDGFYFDAVRQR